MAEAVSNENSLVRLEARDDGTYLIQIIERRINAAGKLDGKYLTAYMAPDDMMRLLAEGLTRDDKARVCKLALE